MYLNISKQFHKKGGTEIAENFLISDCKVSNFNNCMGDFYNFFFDLLCRQIFKSSMYLYRNVYII